jgi:hypothetical protein
MQKGQKTEDKHAESWGQGCWVLGWRHTTALVFLFYFFYFASFLYSLKPYFYSLKPFFLSIL